MRWKVETVYRTARAILGNDQDADATQDALIAGWRRLPSLREPDRFDAWLGRITVNECRMVLRRRRGGAYSYTIPRAEESAICTWMTDADGLYPGIHTADPIAVYATRFGHPTDP